MYLLQMSRKEAEASSLRLFTTFTGRRANNPDSSTGGTEFGKSSGISG